VSGDAAGRGPVLVVHGGAGNLESDEDRRLYLAGVEAALDAGLAVLERGAREAALAAVAYMEAHTHFASNELLDSGRNRDLFLNAVNWLMGDVESISIRPNTSRASRFQLSLDQFRTIRSLSLFVLPEMIAVLGVFTWWSRRNPAG
jgi:hypothetical protein